MFDGYMKKISIGLVVFTVILFTFYLSLQLSNNELVQEEKDMEVLLNSKNEELSNCQLTLENLNLELSNLNKSLNENNSELIDLQSGDNYHLHDPLWDEVLDFLDNNEFYDIDKMIDEAKNEGIRCAFVDVAVEGNYSFYLMGFDTLDYGMVYIEPSTSYLVNPEVGLNYYDCVEDQPYGSSLPEDEDTIIEILVMW